MELNRIIRKNLHEYHDIIRHDSSIELLSRATDSLADTVRYLELLTQEVDHKDCNDVVIKVLDILRHPMGNVSDGSGGFTHKNHSNVLAMLEMISTIIGREKYKTIVSRNEEFNSESF